MDDTRLRQVIECALEQETGQGDVTSASVLPVNAIARGRVVTRQAGVLAGLSVADKVFARVNPLIAFTPLVDDGARAEAGDELATVVGPATSVLAAERTALGLLCRMSGIATLTRRYADAAMGTNAVILGSRKATPCLGEIDQWAIHLGGGGSVPTQLSDEVFIRRSHAMLAGGLQAAIASARQSNTGLQIVVEAQTWAQLDEALPLEPDRIVLTGLPTSDVADAVRWVAGRVPVEVSGPIPLADVRALAQTGVDYVSVDTLGQHVRPMRITLEVDAPPA